MTAPFGHGLSVAKLAEDALAFIEQHWDAAVAADTGVYPLPERRYLAGGEPRSISWDCDQLVITLSGIGIGTSESGFETTPKGGSSVLATGVRHAVFSVQLVRDAPRLGETTRGGRPKLPSVEAIHAGGLMHMRDAGLLSQAVLMFCGQLNSRFPGQGVLVEAGATAPIGPDGGYFANEATFSVTALDLE